MKGAVPARLLAGTVKKMCLFAEGTVSQKRTWTFLLLNCSLKLNFGNFFGLHSQQEKYPASTCMSLLYQKSLLNIGWTCFKSLGKNKVCSLHC